MSAAFARPFGDLAPRAAAVVAGVPLVLLLVLSGPEWAFTLLVAAAALLGARELARLLDAPGGRAAAWAGAALAAGLVVAPAAARRACPGTEAALRLADHVVLTGLATLTVGLVLLGAAFVRGPGRIRRTWAWPAVLAFGGVLPAALVVARGAGPGGGAWVAIALAATWGADIGGYLGGRAFGRQPLAPAISPRKTWEGALAGMALGTVAAALTARVLLAGQPILWGPLVTGVFLGQAGDLLESAAKRAAGVADSGRLLPGGGGMLDAVDGLWLAAPWFAVLARLHQALHAAPH